MLVLEGVEGRSPQPIRINLFIDETDANRRNGTDGPRFLGSIQILPSSGLVRKSGYMFDLSEMVGAGARAFALTLVPVIGVDEEPRDVDLRIGRILIRRKRL